MGGFFEGSNSHALDDPLQVRGWSERKRVPTLPGSLRRGRDFDFRKSRSLSVCPAWATPSHAVGVRSSPTPSVTTDAASTIAPT
jgi:hypothetical protein